MPCLSPRRRLLLSGCAAAWFWPAGRARGDSAVVTIAAASDLQYALTEIAEDYRRQTGKALRLVFGSSGQLTAQILQGAPFDVFLSADEDHVARLVQAGRTVDGGRLYAVGRIGLLVPRGSALRADGELRDLAAALDDGRLRKLAIANPEHAPYGARAREALQRAGLWERVQSRLVLGENVAQATQFALSGSAQGGIVAKSLARAPQIATRAEFALIAADWHTPLRQRMVLMRGAPPAAREFFEHLDGPAGRAAMARWGFELP